jgi:hypothetical protein
MEKDIGKFILIKKSKRLIKTKKSKDWLEIKIKKISKKRKIIKIRKLRFLRDLILSHLKYLSRNLLKQIYK